MYIYILYILELAVGYGNFCANRNLHNLTFGFSRGGDRGGGLWCRWSLSLSLSLSLSAGRDHERPREGRVRRADGRSRIYGRPFDFVIKLWSKRAARRRRRCFGHESKTFSGMLPATVLPPQPVSVPTVATTSAPATSLAPLHAVIEVYIYIYLCGRKHVNHINYDRVQRPFDGVEKICVCGRARVCNGTILTW